MLKLENLKFEIDDIILVIHTKYEKSVSLVKSIYNLLKKKFPVRAEMLLGEVSKVDAFLKKTKESQSFNFIWKRNWLLLKKNARYLRKYWYSSEKVKHT